MPKNLCPFAANKPNLGVHLYAVGFVLSVPNLFFLSPDKIYLFSTYNIDYNLRAYECAIHFLHYFVCSSLNMRSFPDFSLSIKSASLSIGVSETIAARFF